MLEFLVTAKLLIVEILLAFRIFLNCRQLKMLTPSHFIPVSRDQLILDF